MSLAIREAAEREIKRLQVLTGIAILILVGYAGISKRTWREWQSRRGIETKHNSNLPRAHYLTPEEVSAIVAYCSERVWLTGYRVMCYEMIDRNIAYVSPNSVYNVIKRYNLTEKRVEALEEAPREFVQPKAIHEQWHIDFSYIRIGDAFYYFVGILDGYSRKMLSWKLCENMNGLNAELLVTETKEQYSEAKNPRLISDNGGQFISKDFEELLVLLQIPHTFTSPNHPQSNGKIERFNRTLKLEHVRRTAYIDFDDARLLMAKWIAYYNSQRLHSAIDYLTPNDVFHGNREKRLAERREKLHTAYINRQGYWKSHPATP